MRKHRETEPREAPPAEVSKPADDRLGGIGRTQVIRARGAIVLLGETSFGAVLVSLGIAVASTSMGARLEEPRTWGNGDLYATVAFASLLAVLGCLERWVFGYQLSEPRVATTPSGAARASSRS